MNNSISYIDGQAINLLNYTLKVKNCHTENECNSAIAYKQKGDNDAYNQILSDVPTACISGCREGGTFISNGFYALTFNGHTGLQQIESLARDKYVASVNVGFDKQSIIVIVKSDSPQSSIVKISGLGQYFFETHGLIMASESYNIEREIIIGNDRNIRVNEKNHNFVPKASKQVEPLSPFFYNFNDLLFIIDYIELKKIDVVKKNLDNMKTIASALFIEFGDTGKEYFDKITKYSDIKSSFKWGNMNDSNFKVSMSDMLSVFVQSKIDIYSESTKKLINAVQTFKNKGGSSVVLLLSTLGELTYEETKIVGSLFELDADYNEHIVKDLSEIKQLEKYIRDEFEPVRNTLTQELNFNRNVCSNDIYVACKDKLDFKVTLTDVEVLLGINDMNEYDPIKEFFIENACNVEGIISKVSSCLLPYNTYTDWAFKKWVLGSVHNWTRSPLNKSVSPLTLVVIGGEQGIGKTHFLTSLFECFNTERMPISYATEKLDGKQKDSTHRMTTNMAVIDDDIEKPFEYAYKALSDTHSNKQRRPYAKTDTVATRRATLCGTSNIYALLDDYTGNRRILPVNVTDIDRDKFNSIDLRFMWVEAFNILSKNPSAYVMSREDIEYLRQNTQDNMEEDVHLNLLLNFCSKERTSKFTEPVVVNKGTILNYLSLHTNIKFDKLDITRIFTTLNIDYKTSRQKEKIHKGYKIYVAHDSSLLID